MDRNWQADLECWLAPFGAALGHKTIARMCPAYVAGLIGPGDRKSIQPMAARDSGVSYDQLHHFIVCGVCVPLILGLPQSGPAISDGSVSTSGSPGRAHCEALICCV